MINYWERSRKIFQAILKNGKQSVYKLSEQTGISKSSIYRHLVAMLKRNQHPESEFWETEEGRHFLCRLVSAVLFEFCIKGGVGTERASGFFKRICVDTHVGVSPTALRGKLKHIEELVIEYQRIQEKQQRQTNTPREVIAAGDETFFKEMMLLVLMDLSSGYLLLEEEAEDRSFETWNQKAQARLNEIGVTIRHFVSDRAKALIKLGTEGFGCEKFGSDLFHGQYEISKWMGCYLHRKLAQTNKKVEDLREKLINLCQRDKEINVIKNTGIVLEQQEQHLQSYQTAHTDYHNILQEVSLSVHPFNESNSKTQTTEDVVNKLQICADKFKKIAASLLIPDNRGSMEKFSGQLNDIASNVGVWWVWVKENLIQYDLDKATQEWLIHLLLPVIYWHQQMERTKNPSMKASYKKAWQEALAVWEAHQLSQTLGIDEIERWQDWAAWMVGKFQRSSSAVEGRNGWLSQMYCNGRSLGTRRLKTLTVIHNFDLRRADGSTCAERLFDQEFPDLFEWILDRVGPLPLPRENRKYSIPNPLNLQSCPALSG
ncbi:MAG: DUF6399 domain-containing protein [Thermodesulfobacteriota bacterium]|nr:DUF6399 domain-containing protein [Thermodesulfobacteriota bacterium]